MLLCGEILMKLNISQPTMVIMDLSLCVLHGTRPAPTGGGNSFFWDCTNLIFRVSDGRGGADGARIRFKSNKFLGSWQVGPRDPNTRTIGLQTGQLDGPTLWGPQAQLSRFLENWSRTVGSWGPVCLEPSAQGKTQISEYEKGLSLS